MIILSLDKESKTPLFKQVIFQLKEKIDSNILKPGDKLPATRTFSDQLGVNRSTIYKAYQELWALGYLESKSGSYSYVRNKRNTDFEKQIDSTSIIEWSKRTNPNAEKVINSFRNIGYPFSE